MMVGMAIDVRVIKKKELKDFVATIEHAFGHQLRASDLPVFEKKVDISRLHGAFDSEQIVGTAGVFPFRLTIPGNIVDAAGVTMVGVLPSHRRKGILRRLMRAQMDDARDRGECVAVLFASEESIYQRFGYGFAAKQGHIRIERDRATFLDDDGPVGTARMVPPAERLKVLPSIYDRVRKKTPGMYERSPTWWEAHSWFDPEYIRMGASPFFCAVIEIDGIPEAYATYRIRPKWADDTTPNYTVEVNEAIGTSPLATREIWRYLFGIDLVEWITSYYLPEDWPIFLMLEEPRRARFSFSDSLWLRVVDVKAALEARSYELDTTLVFEIDDPFCEWNAGTWKLDSGDRTVDRTDAAPDLRMNVKDLGAAYLGAFTFAELAAAGRVEGLSEGALQRADAAFVTERSPWAPENF